MPSVSDSASRDASWGHRSAVSTRKGGGFHGYKIHAAVCVVTGLPLAWEVETGRRNESLYVAPLLDAVRARGFKPDTVAMDRGYDNDRPSWAGARSSANRSARGVTRAGATNPERRRYIVRA